MSIASEITRITNLRNRLRTKLTALGIGTVSDDLSDCTDAIENITAQAAQTITPSGTTQTIASGKYLTGAQTVEAVVTSNLTAANIVSGVTVKVGTATDDDSVASVTGTASGGGGDLDALISGRNITGEIASDATRVGMAFAYTIDSSNDFTISLPNVTATNATYTFQSCGASEISLPSLATVPERCFDGCAAQKIVLPSNASLGAYCFSACSNLTDVSFLENRTSGTSTDRLFINCTSLPHLYFPKNMTVFGTFGQSQCQGCTSLEWFRAPNLTSLMRSATFSGCTALRLADIGSCASFSVGTVFSGCTSLEVLIIRKTSVMTINNVNNFTNVGATTPFTVYCPSALIEDYKIATNWSTIYGEGRVVFAALEGSVYESKTFVYDGVPSA